MSAFAAGGDAAEPRDSFDVAIVGAGPGGMTAAIYASRARLSTVVLERNTAGGIMSVTERVENYPGFPEGITGFELAEKMKQQACQFGADLREIDGVVSLEQRADGAWTVVTDEASVTARAVILSPGVEARKLGVPGEAEFMGRGVSYCATCDGPLYRGKEVVVIGGGNAAVEEGMFLARFASTVHGCTAATPCAPPPSPRSAPSPSPTCTSSGTVRCGASPARPRSRASSTSTCSTTRRTRCPCRACSSTSASSPRPTFCAARSL